MIEPCDACKPADDEKNHPVGMIFVGWGHGWQPCQVCGGSGVKGPITSEDDILIRNTRDLSPGDRERLYRILKKLDEAEQFVVELRDAAQAFITTRPEAFPPHDASEEEHDLRNVINKTLHFKRKT